MNKNNIILSSTWIALLALFVGLLLHTLSKQNLSDTLILGIIAGVTTVMTVLGTVLVTQMTNAHASKRDREAEIRKIKQENYNKLIEAMSSHLAYQTGALTGEGIDNAKTEFCRETNRLPLYASQAVVEWVNSIAAGKQTNADFDEFYTLLRADLCSSSYQDFEQLPTIHFQLPGNKTGSEQGAVGNALPRTPKL